MAEAKINSKSFGLAGAIVAAIYWSVYSAGSFVLLAAEVCLSGYYGYTDLSNYNWKPEIARFFAVLIFLSLGAGLTLRLIAAFYNLLNKNSGAKLP